MHHPCGDGGDDVANTTWNYLKLAHSFFLFFPFFRGGIFCLFVWCFLVLLIDWLGFLVISTYGNMTIENIRLRLLLIQICNLGSYSLFLLAGIQLKQLDLPGHLSEMNVISKVFSKVRWKELNTSIYLQLSVVYKLFKKISSYNSLLCVLCTKMI